MAGPPRTKLFMPAPPPALCLPSSLGSHPHGAPHLWARPGMTHNCGFVPTGLWGSSPTSGEQTPASASCLLGSQSQTLPVGAQEATGTAGPPQRPKAQGAAILGTNSGPALIRGFCPAISTHTLSQSSPSGHEAQPALSCFSRYNKWSSRMVCLSSLKFPP